MPIDEERMRKLSVNGVYLLDRMDPNHAFITNLSTAGCITRPQRQHILDLVHERDRNDKLLEFLTRRSIRDFENFIRILSTEQAHLVKILLTDGGKTVLMCELYRLSIWFEIHGSVLSKFKSYLTFRSFRAKCDKDFSSEHISSCGVPQVSVLGPLLFVMYTTPLSTLISTFSKSPPLRR